MSENDEAHDIMKKLTKNQISDFKQAFALFDHDSNGSISAVELGKVLKALGQNPSPNELNDMINEVDVDGSGSIEFAEFVILMTHKVREMSKEEEIREAFAILDKENKGTLTAKNLKYFMRKVAHLKLSSEEAEAMIEFASGSDNGIVTFDDFLEVVKQAQVSSGGQVDPNEEQK